MAASVVIAVIAIFTLGVILGVLAVVSMAIRREERRFRLDGDTPPRLAGLILWSIFKNPKHSSEISRTPTGDLTVNRD